MCGDHHGWLQPPSMHVSRWRLERAWVVLLTWGVREPPHKREINSSFAIILHTETWYKGTLLMYAAGLRNAEGRRFPPHHRSPRWNCPTASRRAGQSITTYLRGCRIFEAIFCLCFLPIFQSPWLIFELSCRCPLLLRLTGRDLRFKACSMQRRTPRSLSGSRPVAVL